MTACADDDDMMIVGLRTEVLLGVFVWMCLCVCRSLSGLSLPNRAVGRLGAKRDGRQKHQQHRVRFQGVCVCVCLHKQVNTHSKRFVGQAAGARDGLGRAEATRGSGQRRVRSHGCPRCSRCVGGGGGRLRGRLW